MAHYKAPDNSVHWLDDEIFQNLLPSGSEKISDEEAADLREPTAEQVLTNITKKNSSRLAEIDFLTLRPLRAVYAGTDTAEDHAKLAALEEEAQQLRQELANAN